MSFVKAASLSFLPFVVIGTAVGFTSKDSFLRLAFFPILLLVSYNAFQASHLLQQQLAATFVGASGVALVIKYVEVVLINRWAVAEQGPASTKGGLRPSAPSKAQAKQFENASLWQKLALALHVASNSRYPATPWAVKGIPNFSHDEPAWRPSRAKLIATRLVVGSLSYLFLDALDYAGDPETAAVIFDNSKIPFFSRLGEVSAEEAIIRIVNVFVFWAAGAAVIQMQFCVCSVVGLLLPGSSVDDWPPVFGRLVDCWSIRQFWGEFWHQNLRRTFSSPAHYVTYEMLGLRRGTFLARYLFIALTFTQSGLLHVFVDYLSFIPPSASGAMVFFPMQTVGIMLEDGVKDLYKKVFGSPRTRASKLFVRIVGYAWIVLWMAYSLPIWVYPTMRTGGGRGRLLPFSVIDLVTA